MSALSRFQASIEGALHLHEMYVELRKLRGLGARGRLGIENEDLLWMPRSSVVMSMSALDAYVHAVIIDRVPALLLSNSAPDSLLELYSSLLPVKNANGFKEIMKYINSTNPVQQLTDKVRDHLSFMSYQAPEKITAGFELVGVKNIFQQVSDTWQGRNSTADDLRRFLANYYKRRNQIAHEGDVEHNGSSRAITPKYAKDCHDFIESLVTRMNKIIYP